MPAIVVPRIARSQHCPGGWTRPGLGQQPIKQASPFSPGAISPSPFLQAALLDPSIPLYWLPSSGSVCPGGPDSRTPYKVPAWNLLSWGTLSCLHDGLGQVPL